MTDVLLISLGAVLLIAGFVVVAFVAMFAIAAVSKLLDWP